MAASSGGFAITISATDRATKTLDAVNKRIAAFTAPIRRYAAVQKKFAESTGMSKIARGMRTIGVEAITATQRLSRVVAPLRTITGAASVAGMYALVSSWAGFAQRLGFASQRLGIAANQLLGLQGAARLAGASAESMTSGMETLSAAITDALGGRNIQALQYFKALHISLTNVDGSTKTAAQVLPELADALKNVAQPALKLRVETTLLGGAAADLYPLMTRGSEGIAKLVAEAQRYSSVTDAQVAAAQRLYRAQTRVELAVQGLTTTISASLSPVLAPLLTHMADWIRMNRDWLSTRINEKVQASARWLQSINWQAVGNGIDRVGNGIASVVNFLGGWQNAAIGLLAMWAGKWLAGMLAPIASIGLALAGLIGKIGQARAEMAGLSVGAGLPGPRATGGPSRGLALAGAGGMAYRIIEDWINGTGPTMSEAEGKRLGLGENPFSNFFSGAPRGAPSATRGPLSAMRPGDFQRYGNDVAARQKEAIAYFEKQGWSPAQAAGMVANFTQESSMNPALPGDKGGAYGIGQWHADRQAEFARLFGHSMKRSTFEEQLAFSNWELHNTEAAAGAQLGAARTPEQAGAAVSRYYERPAAADRQAELRAQLAGQLASAAGMPAGFKNDEDAIWARMRGRSVPSAAAAAPPATIRAPAIATGQPVNVGNGAAGPAVAAAGPQGEVKVTVTGQSLPPGISLASKASGNVIHSGPRIETGMPLGAAP